MSDSGVAPDDDRLSGWKEIAQYLRRSVRSVQRWERELDLPVLRKRTAKGGQMVYASRAALDAWLTRYEGELPPPDTEDQAEPVEPLGDVTGSDLGTDDPDEAVLTPEPPAQPPPPTRARRWGLVAAGALVAVLVSAYVMLPVRTVDYVDSTRVIGQRLEARSAAGRVLWSHDFGQDVAVKLITPIRQTTHSAVVVDLDGDGAPEQLVPIDFSLRGYDAPSSDAVYAFSESGAVVWEVRPDDIAVTCRGGRFTGPWRATALLVSTAPGPKRVWVAFVHHTWWPSFVMEVSPTGEQAMRYVQAGWVRSLEEWPWQGREHVAAGGVLNEHARASLLVFDPDVPRTVMSGSTPEFSCDEAGDPPVHGYTFPPLEVHRAQQQAYTITDRLQRIGRHMRLDLGHFAHVVIDDDGQVTEFSFTDLYRKEHDSLAAARLIHHSTTLCPEPTQIKDIHTWSPDTGWTSTPFVPTAAPARTNRP